MYLHVTVEYAISKIQKFCDMNRYADGFLNEKEGNCYEKSKKNTGYMFGSRYAISGWRKCYSL